MAFDRIHPPPVPLKRGDEGAKGVVDSRRSARKMIVTVAGSRAINVGDKL